jgi:tetratricopeptide (TPR) repeat protein
MLENEMDDQSFGELMDVVKKYEDAEKQKQSLFLEEETYIRIIDFYADNREFKRAASVVENALEQYHYSCELWIKKAEILAEQSRYDEALDVLQNAENLDKTEIAIYLIRADIYLAQGKHEEGLEVISTALLISDDQEDTCDLYLEQADIYEDMGLYLEVMEGLKNCLEVNPANEEALNRLWFCTELTEQYEDSRKFHKQIVDLYPYNHLAWFNLGHAYAGLKRYDEAIESLEFAVAIDENFDLACEMMGDVYFDMKEYAKALEAYHDTLKIGRPNKETLCKAAECYSQLKDYHKARVYFRKALAIDPNYDEAFYLVGETYRAEANFSKAVESFERAAKISPENVDYLNALGDSCIMNDEIESAVLVFERVLAIDPKIKQHYINLATAYYGMESFRECFDTLTAAAEKFDNPADIYYIKFVFYNQIGNRNEALVNLQNALLLNFEEHTTIFEMDERLETDETVINMIEQFRPEL